MSINGITHAKQGHEQAFFLFPFSVLSVSVLDAELFSLAQAIGFLFCLAQAWL